MRSNPNENQVKSKIKSSTYKNDPLPLYRSYGVKRREHKTAKKLSSLILTIFATVILSVFLGVILFAFFTFYFYSPLLVRTVLTALIAFLVLKTLTKTLRRRLSLFSKLKKLCKQGAYKHGYKLTVKRKGIRSLKWSPKEIDIVFETNTRVYYIHLLGVRKYHQKLRFMSENEMLLIKPPPNNIFAVIYDLKEKYKKFEIDFSEAKDIAGKKTVRAIIVNPTCAEFECKISENAIVPSGSRDSHFGYTVYTGSSFINEIRDIEKSSEA